MQHINLFIYLVLLLCKTRVRVETTLRKVFLDPFFLNMRFKENVQIWMKEWLQTIKHPWNKVQNTLSICLQEWIPCQGQRNQSCTHQTWLEVYEIRHLLPCFPRNMVTQLWLVVPLLGKSKFSCPVGCRKLARSIIHSTASQHPGRMFHIDYGKKPVEFVTGKSC